MKAIILAAGMGTRLGSLTKNLPKMLLKLNGITILDFQLMALKSSGIRDIIIVSGFKHERVINHVKKCNFCSSSEVNIKFVRNEKFYETNNAYSLCLALNSLDKIDNEVIILDGDIIFDVGLLDELLNSSYQNVAVCDNSRKATSEDAKVLIKNNYILAIGKEIQSEFIYTSLIRLGGEFLRKFSKQISNERYNNDWYSIPLTDMLKSDPSYKLHTIYTNGYRRQEVDTLEDLILAKKSINFFFGK